MWLKNVCWLIHCRNRCHRGNCCSFGPCCGSWHRTREDLSPADRDRQIGGDQWCLLFSLFSLELFLFPHFPLQTNNDVTVKVLTTEPLKTNLLMSAVTTEPPLQRYSERRVWCVCSGAYVFYQLSSQATGRPHPSPLLRGPWQWPSKVFEVVGRMTHARKRMAEPR